MALLLSRLGRFCARRRFLVFISWAVIAVLLAGAALLGFTKNSDTETPGFDVPGTESSTALNIVEEKFPSAEGAETSALQLVIQTKDPAGVAAPTVEVEIAQAVAVLRGLPNVESVGDPFDPAAPYISPDGSTAVAQINFTGIEDDDAEAAEAATDAVAKVAGDLRAAGLTAEVGGTLASEIPQILGPTEIIGAGIAFLVLFLTFGSLVAAGANMLGALIGVGVGIIGVFAWGVIAPIGSVTPILAVMLGLAVGIDYCLFILARFRSELVAGQSIDNAVAKATGTAGSSVLFAGLTVIIALAGLSVVGISFLSEMGIAAAFAVTIAVLMALTFLPALMKVLGKRVLSHRDRMILDGDGPTQIAHSKKIRFIDRWADFVTSRRALSLILGVATLFAIALPATGLQTTLSVPGGENPESTQRSAYTLIQNEFGGVQSPLIVLAEGDSVQTQLRPVANLLADLPNIQTIIPAGVSEDGATALLQVIPTGGPIDESTRQLVENIRANANEIPGITLSVTGETALGIDSDEMLQRALITYIGLIVALSFVLLVLLFRSILVPLIATVGYLLSFAAALGATVAVFQNGLFDSVIPAPQGDPLLSFLPIILAGILFGLAMDYQVFLVSRMHEAHEKGYSPKEAILDGFGKSGPLVVAAALIMAAVFGGFALSHSSLVASIAFGLTVGVVADAFIVRMILVPAALAMLGDAAWWLPKFLQKVLPRIDTEGLALESTTPQRKDRAEKQFVKAL